MRPLALEVEDVWHATLSPHLGDTRARVAVAVINSLVMRGIMTENPMSLSEIKLVLRCGLD